MSIARTIFLINIIWSCLLLPGIHTHAQTGDGLHEKLPAGRVHVVLGKWYTNTGRYENSIKEWLQALDIAQKACDSVSVRAAYAALAENYVFIARYEQALAYDRARFNYITAKDRNNGTAFTCTIDDDAYRAGLYHKWYNESHNAVLLDSSFAYINKIPLTGPNKGRWQELYHLCIAEYYYELKDYKAAIAHMNISLQGNYYYGARAKKEAIMGICLLETGRVAEGKKMLLNNKAVTEDLDLAQAAYKTLYKTEKETGNPGKALTYYEQYVQLADSAVKLAQQGEVFEIARRYDIQQKQSELDKLAVVYTAQKKQRNAILLGSIAVTLLLLCAIAILYGLAKRRQLTGIRIQQALDHEKRNMEKFLQVQDDRIRAEREVAVLEQRRRISRDLHDGLSSTLAALKYYINDIRLHRISPSEQKMLMDIEEEVSAIYGQVRDYMHKLYHGKEEHEVDLNDFLHGLSAQFSNDAAAFRIKVLTNGKDIAERLDAHRQTQLYFIIKEGIANAIKYAGAATVTISIRCQEALCAFSISDNGAGMENKIAKGIGLNSIADRVTALNGKFKIRSAGHGTSLEGMFPI